MAGGLRTLRDAGHYLAALPKTIQSLLAWQLAAEMLLGATERGGIVMLAEMAMRRALNADGNLRPPLQTSPTRWNIRCATHRGKSNEGPCRDTYLACFKCCPRSRVQDVLNGRRLHNNVR